MIRSIVMTKRYPKIEEKPQELEDPAVAYGKGLNYSVLGTGTSIRDGVMGGTMSVDEYFDELIKRVRQDYANV